MISQKKAYNPHVTYYKLARHATQLYKMTYSTSSNRTSPLIANCLVHVPFYCTSEISIFLLRQI